MEFVTTPDETGKGRVIVDGRYYGLPVEAVEQIKRMQEVLTRMTATEPCDCGCPWKSKPKLSRPIDYHMAAKYALGMIEAVEEGDQNETQS